ncbi:MAG: hypothetical protein R6T89_07650 [Candidatus Syntrophosphaera sp.]
MKKFLPFIVIILICSGLQAQTGLFGLSFGDHLNKADSLMSQSGFVAADVEGSMVKYFSEYNKLVESIVLFVDPETEILAGWFVKYSQHNTEKQDRFVEDQLHLMHGEEVFIDTENQQVIWNLNDTRSVHYEYVPPNNLAVLYYDSALKELFELPPSARTDGSAQ